LKDIILVDHFDLHLNKIQKLKPQMTWFEKQPQIYAGDFITVEGKPFTYNDDSMNDIVGIAMHDSYNDDDHIDVLSPSKQQIIRISF
jgi:hypothetical protein